MFTNFSLVEGAWLSLKQEYFTVTNIGIRISWGLGGVRFWLNMNFVNSILMGFVVSWPTVKCIKIYYFLIKSNPSLMYSWLLSVRILFGWTVTASTPVCFYSLFQAFQVTMTLSCTGLRAVFPPGHCTCRTMVAVPWLLWGYLTAVLRPIWPKMCCLCAEGKNGCHSKRPHTGYQGCLCLPRKSESLGFFALPYFCHLMDLYFYLTTARHQETAPYQWVSFWLCYDPWHC